MLGNRVGTILKEAREARKMTIRDVAEETNLTPKYIEALENEDYSQFPGETYTNGFLTNYAEFLNLDVDHILNLYRGIQIDQSQSPIEELTKPSFSARSFMPDRNAILGVVALAIVVGIIALFVTGTVKLPSSDAVADNAKCEERTIQDILLAAAGTNTGIETIDKKNQLSFRAGGLNMRLCLVEIDRSRAGRPLAVFQVAGGADVYRFEAAENETVILDNRIPQFTSLDRKVLVTPRLLGDESVRVQLESGEQVQVDDDMIRVTLEFVQDSYFDWVDDGTVHRGIYMQAGERRTLEARNRLEIKVGNGAGVRIIREGAPPRIAGPIGKIVNISYRKVPDPLDRERSKIEETIEVAP